jgi:hypothetical protein
VVALGDRAEDDARVADQLAEVGLLAVEHPENIGRVGGERAEVAERVVQRLRGRVGVLLGALDRQRRLFDPLLERRPRGLVERGEDLVELDRLLHLRARDRAAVRQVALVRVTRRQLRVGLAEQRLLAQDELRVLRDRRVLRVDVERDLGRHAALVELLRLDLADRDPGHAHVGLVGEVGRLGHVHREPVALRLQRDRAAERQPQEDQQPEAGQREGCHCEHAREAG